MPQRVFAVAAHPDDIEFTMAGTLFLLKAAGWEIHLMHIGNGSCGSMELPPEEIVRVREGEARKAAAMLDAHYYPPLVNDIDILYARPLLARMGAILREAAPDILLVPSPQDYMEDHQNASRLAVTAAFCRSVPNYPTEPPREPTMQPVTVYHAQPHGNCDPLCNEIQPSLFVDITGVLARKRAMLNCHQSQKTWLDATQGMDSYLRTMEDLSREVGGMSGCFEYAEGFRKHLHYGFCSPDDDPLKDALADACCPA